MAGRTESCIMQPSSPLPDEADDHYPTRRSPVCSAFTLGARRLAGLHSLIGDSDANPRFHCGLETSVSFTAYTPFVVLAAIFLAWQYAAVIAVGAAALADLLFVGPPLEILERRSDVFGVLTFLAACGVTIFIAQLSRRAVDSHTRLKASQHSGVIFSLEDGQAWATWYGHETPVCLGPKEEVVEMMRDFIAQVELGEHFDKRSQR